MTADLACRQRERHRQVVALIDRLVPLCDLLLGAAHADNELKDREQDEVRGLLEDIGGHELSVELETRLATFDPAAFDLAAAAQHFLADPVDDRKRVLYLVAAINDVDDEVDFAEDEYLRALARALELPDDSLNGLTIDVVEDIQEQRATIARVRKGPPPPPPERPRTASVDVDLD
jgi:uncharacterized membrane protein YebE (DUF533 family)